jgi:hypothetical protein
VPCRFESGWYFNEFGFSEKNPNPVITSDDYSDELVAIVHDLRSGDM